MDSKKGVFFFTDDDGNETDEGFVDQMLDNEEQITAELVRLGIIENNILKE